MTIQVSLAFNATIAATTPSKSSSRSKFSSLFFAWILEPDNLGLILGLSLGLGIPLLLVVGLLIYWAVRRSTAGTNSPHRTAF